MIKRSSQVALLLMGTTGVGGTAYSLMPSENCTTERPAIVAPGSASVIDCIPRGRSSSSSSGGYRSYGSSSSQSLYGGDSSSPSKSGGTADSGSHITRGGFGSFAHAFTSHFSGGG